MTDIFIIGTPILLIPFFYSTQLLDPALIPKFLATAIYLTIFLFIISRKIARSKTGFFPIVRNRLFLFYILYFFVAGVSLCYTSNFADGLFEWLKIGLSFIFLVSLTLYYQDSEDFSFNSAKAITWLSFIISVAGLIQFFSLANEQVMTHQDSYSVSLTFAHKNLFAQILGLTIPFSVYCSLRSRSWMRIISILSVFSVLCLVVISLSRTVWIAILIGTCSTIILYLFNERKTLGLPLLMKSWTSLLLVIVIPFAAIIISTFIYSKYGTLDTFEKQLSSISNLSHGSAKNRIQLWEKSAQLIVENPLLGSGLGSWEIEILKLGAKGMKSEEGVIFYQRPHNDFIWLLCETGILGAGCFVLIFVVLFSYMLRTLRQSNQGHIKLLCYLMFFGLLEYVVISCLSFPKERMEHAIILSFLMAPIIIERHQLTNSQIYKVRYENGMIIVLVFLLFAVAIGFQRMSSEYHVKKALMARERIDYKNTIEEVDKAESIFYTLDPMSTPISWYRGSAHFRLGNIPAAFADFQKSYDLHPYHVHCINNLATSHQLLGNEDEALGLYSEAMRLYPGFEDSRVNLSIINLNRGEYSIAYEIIRGIQSDTQNQKVLAILNKILPARVDSMLNISGNEELVELMTRVGDDMDWIINVHFNSVTNNRSFESQLIIDARYLLKEFK